MGEDLTPTTIKALPLWQPWASLVAMGAKRVETRAYPPGRIGLRAGQRIAIHATKTTKDPFTRQPLSDFCEMWPFTEHVPDWDVLPLGAILATVTLLRASQVTQEAADQLERTNEHERAFGNYQPGRWAWVLGDVRRLDSPVPFTGSQGTFDVPLHLLGEAVSNPTQGVLL